MLSDAPWSIIEGLPTHPTGRKNKPIANTRLRMEGTIYLYLYQYRTSIAWRDLTAVVGPWQTVWTEHRWMAIGPTCDRGLAKDPAAADAAGLVDWSLSMDFTVAARISTRRTPPLAHGLDRTGGICRNGRLSTVSAVPAADYKHQKVIERDWCCITQRHGLATRDDSGQARANVPGLPESCAKTIVSGTPYSGSQNRSSFPNGSMMVIVGPPGASRSMPGRSLPAAPRVTCTR